MAFLDETGLARLLSKLQGKIATLNLDGQIPVRLMHTMVPTDGSSTGDPGIVPTPNAGDANKYLKGGAGWATVQAGEVAVPANVIDANPTTVQAAITSLKGQIDQHPIVYFAPTQEQSTPSNPVEGMIWLKPKVSSS